MTSQLSLVSGAKLPEVSNPDKSFLLERVRSSAAYLLRQIDHNGRFVYRRDSREPQWIGEGYNLLRHAGSLYALADSLALLEHTSLPQSVQRSLIHLLGWIKPVNDLSDALVAWSIPNENDTVKSEQVKLGGTALSLLALIRLKEHYPLQIDNKILIRLAEGLLWMQREDGSFFSKWTSHSNCFDEAWSSLFYPGQACFALAELSKMHDLEGSEQWLHSALKGLTYLATSRDSLSRQDVPLDHWALLATGACSSHLTQPLIRHARLLVDAILSRQQKYLKHDAVSGAFSATGSTTTTATCLEGLQSASPIFSSDYSLYSAIAESSHRGIQYLASCQLSNGVWAGGMPSRCGSRPSEIRIDYVQHALSAFIGHIRILESNRIIRTNPILTQQHFSVCIDESLNLGLQFLLGSVKPDGSMRYLLDLSGKTVLGERHQVREAGGVWGLSLYLSRDRLTQYQRDSIWLALGKCMSYLIENSEIKYNRLWPVPEQATEGMLGTAALYGLALVEMLAQPDCPDQERYEVILRQLIGFVLACRNSEGRFHARYRLNTGEAYRDPSPYYDGEVLLLLSRCASLLDYTEYRVVASQLADIMYSSYAEGAITQQERSDTCKGFYQWSSMAFRELFLLAPEESRWVERTFALADWILDIHEVLKRGRNTGYAFEGLLAALALAHRRSDTQRIRRLCQAIEKGLIKLTSWQVGSSIQLNSLMTLTNYPTQAIGGVLSAPTDNILRIDTAQHQMHALLLAEKIMMPN